MKIKAAFLIFLILAIVSCKSDEAFAPPINGLSLYWDHEVFGEEGRRLRFEATSTNTFNNNYELEFNTIIVGRTITVLLTESIDKGECPFFPMPGVGGDPTKCNASGDFYLADKDLEDGVYSLKIITPFLR